MLTFNEPVRIYKINELAKKLDRIPLTIKRWEASGVIPKARRDSRGWRYYTEDDVKEIIRIVKENSYFKNVPEN
jgi:DNA-binding transcriptional MerR regulator